MNPGPKCRYRHFGPYADRPDMPCRAAGYQNRTTERAVAPLLGYLRDLRAAPPAAVLALSTPAEVVVGKFCDYLASERDLAAGTVHHHRRLARLFLSELGISGETDLVGVTAAAVTSFAVSQAQRRSPGDIRAATRSNA
jgi:integrase/recombinase XerD